MRIRLSEHFSYGKLLRFTLPSMLMMVFTSVYGVVDGYFVSNYAGKEAFTAVNFIMPFLMILGTLGFMFGNRQRCSYCQNHGRRKNRRSKKAVFAYSILNRYRRRYTRNRGSVFASSRRTAIGRFR